MGKRAPKRKSARRSGKFTVELKGAIRKKYKVIPGRLEVGEGESVVIENRTGLKWQVWVPPGNVLKRVAQSETRNEYKVVAGARKGRFPFAVYVYDGKPGKGAKREFAEGNSAPHVIIN